MTSEPIRDPVIERIVQAGANPSAGYPWPANGNATGLGRTPFPTWWTSCSPLDVAKGPEALRRSISRPCGPGSPGWKLEVLTPCSWFGRRLLELGGHLGQRFRDSLNDRCIDAVEKATPDAREVNRPCGLQFGHAPRSEPRNVAPCVGRACRLRHEATGLEIVHQAGHPAGRQVGRAGQVGHPQLAIGGFGKVHDRRVLARRQPSTSDQVVVQMTRNDFDKSHHGAPERFFGRREWRDGGHALQNSLLNQAILRSWTRPSAADRRLDHHQTRRTPTVGAPHDE